MFLKDDGESLQSSERIDSGDESLLLAQIAFLAKTNTVLATDRRAAPKQFAVYLQCGSGSLHSRWLSDRPKPWDLIVNHYEADFLGKINCDVEFMQAGILPGTKFTSFSAILAKWSHLISGYDYILLLDDDVVLTEADITKLFETAGENSLDLAQASLSLDSYCHHPIFFNSPDAFGLRYVNAVEIMMPVISRRALKAGAHLFGQTISGWGLDLALGDIVWNQLGGKAAVIDDIVARHKKPIDIPNGRLYKMLREQKIEPYSELLRLKRIYGFVDRFYQINN